jgi:hypothetical protein
MLGSPKLRRGDRGPSQKKRCPQMHARFIYVFTRGIHVESLL